MARKRTKLSGQLRHAIDGCGKSRYVISQDTGIDQATLSRFMNGKGGLSIPILDTLADYLDLDITIGGKTLNSKSKKRKRR